ncbi:MAG: hypothetical protein AAFQ38_18240 [Pseudomonadota bacterium]
MDQEFQRLLNMHDMAARFGDGLKLELHELLIGRRKIEAETVRLLDVPLVVGAWRPQGVARLA